MGRSALELRIEYTDYLDALNISVLRSLGRELGVEKPTTKTKSDLINLIIGILMGEVEPIQKSSRGAPVKAQEISPKILLRLCEIGGNAAEAALERIEGYQNRSNLLMVRASESPNRFMDDVYVGQVVSQEKYFCVYPLDGVYASPTVILEARFKDVYALKEGDVISYSKEDFKDYSKVTEVLRINDCDPYLYQKTPFDCVQTEPLNKKLPFPENKLADWFFPIYKGGRCLIVSPAKCGKTTLLKQLSGELLKNNDYKTLGLLIEQTNDAVFQFRSLFPERNFLATGYEQEAEDHLFIAEFMLKRAKAYMQSGKDVVLFIDGLLALAKAYDEYFSADGRYLSLGVSAKAARFIKKFLSVARDCGAKGSLTLICALPTKTGNPDDDLFFAEIAPMFETQIALDLDLAKKHVYPAVDFAQSHANNANNLLLDKVMKKDGQRVVELLNKPLSYQEFFEKLDEI